LSSFATTPVTDRNDEAARRRSILLVCSCTLISAAAQILMKIGVTHFSLNLVGMLTNVPLIAGYSLYGVFTLMMVMALREGELSLIYPIISLSYVWVTVLSYFIFRDHINLFKLVGITAIMGGVTMLGKGGAK
jgi:drug/metabolite transporter (DMT)-like permease